MTLPPAGTGRSASRAAGRSAPRAYLAALRRRPMLGVLLLLAAACWPNSATSAEVSLARPTPADAAAAGLIGWVALRLLRPDGPVAIRSRWLWPVAALVVTAGVSTTLADQPVLAFAGYVRFLELFVLLPVAVFVAVEGLADAVGLLAGLLAISALQAVVGIVQVGTGTGAGFGSSASRAVGTFGIGDQVSMGNLMAVAAVVLVAALLRLPGRWPLAALAGLPLAVVPLAMSLSRGAMIAFVLAAVLVAAAAGWRQLLGLALLAAGLAVLLSLTGAGDTVVGSRLSTTTSAGTAPDQSVRDRYELWAAAVAVWHAHPVTGVGVKNFAAYRDTYAGLGLSSGGDVASDSSYQRVQLLSPHDEYLLILSEQGTFGLASYLALVLAGLAAPLRLRRARTPAAGFVALAGAGIAVQLAVTSVYGDVAGPSAVLTASCLGLCLATGKLP